MSTQKQDLSGERLYSALCLFESVLKEAVERSENFRYAAIEVSEDEGPEFTTDAYLPIFLGLSEHGSILHESMNKILEALKTLNDVVGDSFEAASGRIHECERMPKILLALSAKHLKDESFVEGFVSFLKEEMQRLGAEGGE